MERWTRTRLVAWTVEEGWKGEGWDGKARRGRIWLGKLADGVSAFGETARAQSVTVGVAFSLVRWLTQGSGDVVGPSWHWAWGRV